MAKIRLTDLVLRDAHQSLLATRMVTQDMLPACERLDKVGYWALEAWGGATFDTCIRFLNEDPWERLRQLKKALPKTPIMMLLRGQNLLGYRHYADDVVEKFVEAAARNGVDVFRIFDAVNDPRNFKKAADAAKKTGKHVQATISFATTPFHTVPSYLKLARELADEGADSLCIKDMAGLLKPFQAFELVRSLKRDIGLPVEVHSHATTGMSVATLVKAAEAGADVLDTCISSVAMGTSHSPTETMVEIFKGTEFDTGLDVRLIVDIAAYFRDVRKKYAAFESSFLGADTRILIAQIPGGMLSNMESQLKEQGAGDKIDAVLAEIPRVQKDSGYVPLVTPTSQIVGTQAVFNVLFGRYQKMTAEFRDLLVGRYGATPAPCDGELVKKALAEAKLERAISHRPADDIPNEFSKLEEEAKRALGTATASVEDVLTYAMFPKVAPEFFKNRPKGPVSFSAGASAIETPVATAPGASAQTPAKSAASYIVTVNGNEYAVKVRPEGTAEVDQAKGSDKASAAAVPLKPAAKGGKPILSPVAGTLVRYAVKEGEAVKEMQTVIIVESMKMELEVKAISAGNVHFVAGERSKIASQQLLAEII
jgi:oxaloacetate decarboxylase (Na+ extruding) subunit alpha